ncbi:MAG: Fe-S cluster assembly sulfur transfer protein SufU [Candidatus Micrarchaeota archaeon]
MEELYQEFIIELYKNPINFGKIQNADYQAEIHNTTCGDIVQLYLKVSNGIIQDAKFTGSGCAISQASASLFTNYLKDKLLADVKKISKKEILALLKIDLSKNPSRMKCALLPLDALNKAIKS